MKSKFYLDCEALSRKEQRALCTALEGLAECDLPLLLELLFVSEEEIRALNKRERGIDAVTDVLSFPASDYIKGQAILSAQHADCVEPVMGMRGGELVKRGARLYLGSVVICEKRAKEQAEEYGHSVQREICYLAVHGVLHCLGYDHESEEDRAEMRQKEEYVMQKLGLVRDS